MRNGGSGVRQDERASRRIGGIQLALLVASVAAIVYGVVEGQALQVLAKGVRVCLECIGIA